VIDYRQKDLAARVAELTAGAGVDRVVDVEFGANVKPYAKALRNHAVVASYASTQAPEPALPFYDLMRLNLTLRLVFVYTMPESAKRRAIEDIARWVAKGRPQFAIAARFALADAVAAHELVESGRKIGHVVLDTA
jgi:NADPH:quinone reductase